VDDRALLGEFLRRRRKALSPTEAGLPARAPRRTPGLRREEVAALATMSTTYYERLERGRGPRPSATVPSAVSAAPRLTGDERAHLFRLAGHTAPVDGGGRTSHWTPGWLISWRRSRIRRRRS
jgi:transcriptional regulator with XRE-family HTH domain